jgi:hypothetical protein
MQCQKRSGAGRPVESVKKIAQSAPLPSVFFKINTCLCCGKLWPVNLGYFCNVQKTAQSKQIAQWAEIRPIGSPCSRTSQQSDNRARCNNKSKNFCHASNYLSPGDQIGRIFADWVFLYKGIVTHQMLFCAIQHLPMLYGTFATHDWINPIWCCMYDIRRCCMTQKSFVV